MGKTILYTLKGAAIGAIGAVCLFVVGFCIELFNMGCAILTCDCDKPMVFDWSGMWGLLFICTIGGAVVGMVYGIYKAKVNMILLQTSSFSRILRIIRHIALPFLQVRKS